MENLEAVVTIKATESELSLDTGIHVNVLKYEEPKKIKTFKKELGEE